ncbi:MAG: DUF192 domain-containing protein [archaeon]
MDKKLILLSIVIIILLLSGCSKETGTNFDYKIREVIVANQTITVQIADNDEKRTQGLMYQEELGEFEGMFFIFEEEDYLNFWMKNTPIPLDIIFINSEFEIENIHTAEPCKRNECLFYGSERPAKYVLEVNAGFSEKYGLSENMMLDFTI